MDTAEPIRKAGAWIVATLTPIWGALIVVAATVESKLVASLVVAAGMIVTIGRGWMGVEKARSVAWSPDTVTELVASLDGDLGAIPPEYDEPLDELRARAEAAGVDLTDLED